MSAKFRALVVSTVRDRGALTAVRALGRAGWYVGVGTPGELGLAGSSRYSNAHHVVSKPRGDGSHFVRGVQQAINEGGYHVVFGGGDDMVAALAYYRDQIPARVAHPSFEAVRTSQDKVALGHHAQAVGLAAPVTREASTAVLTSWTGPVVVKCREHWSPGQTRPHRIDARRFEDLEEAARQVDLIHTAGARAILQEPVDGGLSALVGIFDGERLRGVVQQRSLTLWPTPYGASARAVTTRPDPELVARCEALLQRMQWHGLVELQFLSGAGGEPHLTDINGRFYGSLSLAERAQPGLVDSWARWLIDLPPPHMEPAPAGIRYSWLTGDMRRALQERRGGVLRDVAGTVAWGLRAQHSEWDLRDPGPVLHLATRRLRSRFSTLQS